MGKTDLLCPYCGVEVFQIHTHKDGRLKKVKGGKSKKLYGVVHDTERDHFFLKEDEKNGFIVECKCKEYFFIYLESEDQVRFDKEHSSRGTTILECTSCHEGNLSKTSACPKCGERMVFKK
ncbi:MAG: hypothetical protein ACW968_12125 [Candidatus Thorarchaeota archaeon]